MQKAGSSGVPKRQHHLFSNVDRSMKRGYRGSDVPSCPGSISGACGIPESAVVLLTSCVQGWLFGNWKKYSILSYLHLDSDLGSTTDCSAGRDVRCCDLCEPRSKDHVDQEVFENRMLGNAEGLCVWSSRALKLKTFTSMVGSLDKKKLKRSKRTNRTPTPTLKWLILWHTAHMLTSHTPCTKGVNRRQDRVHGGTIGKKE